MTDIKNIVLTFEDGNLVQTSMDASPCMLQQGIKALCSALEDTARDNALEAMAKLEANHK